MTLDNDGNTGHNLTSLKQKLAAHARSYVGFKSDASEVNAGKAEVIASVENLGINKDAFRMALRIWEWDPDKRAEFYTALEICLDTLEVPYNPQLDLFEPKEDEPSGTTPKPLKPVKPSEDDTT